MYASRVQFNYTDCTATIKQDIVHTTPDAFIVEISAVTPYMTTTTIAASTPWSHLHFYSDHAGRGH